MRILAFDQATNKTGYACFEDGGRLDFGLIDLSKTHKDYPADVKGRAMVLRISELIEEFQPDMVAIEDVALQRNAKVLIELSRIQGGIMAECDKKKLPVIILKPSQWRKICAVTQGAGVKRKELKQAAKDFALEQFGAKATSDEADAICIGWAAYVDANQERKINQNGNKEEQGS